MKVTSAEYARVFAILDARRTLRPLSSYTYVDDPGFTPFGPGTHIFTAWGWENDVPLLECERHNERHEDRITPAGRAALETP